MKKPDKSKEPSKHIDYGVDLRKSIDEEILKNMSDLAIAMNGVIDDRGVLMFGKKSE